MVSSGREATCLCPSLSDARYLYDQLLVIPACVEDAMGRVELRAAVGVGAVDHQFHQTISANILISEWEGPSSIEDWYEASS